MAPTSIFWNGRQISIPGSYTQIDASALASIGLGANGIVAIVGTGEGGKPYTATTEATDFLSFTRPEQAQSTFRSGDLREGCAMLFSPSSDADIPGGAVQVIAMKANPATQSTATFANSTGNAMTLTSRDYGAFTGQINVSIAAGTVAGKKVTVVFEDKIEIGDNLGGTNIFTIKYLNSLANGWGAMTAQVITGGYVKVAATRASMAGKDGDITDLSASGTVNVVSASAGDTTQQVIVYGLAADGTAQSETFTLNGITEVVGAKTFLISSVWGARVIGTVAGAVTVKKTAGATILVTGTGANPSKGLYLGQAMYAGSVLTLVSSGASIKIIVVEGKSATGATQLEKIILTGTSSVAGTAVWSEITAIVNGDMEAAQTLTATATLQTTATQTTIQKVADFYNARNNGTDGFTFTLVTGNTSFVPANLDVNTSATSCYSPTTPGFKADLFACIDWCNNSGSLTTAAAVAGAKDGAPTNTTNPVYLAGGVEGTTTTTDYQNCLNLLKKVYVNSIVLLTSDAAVHAMLKSHCDYMAGPGRMERDGFVGVMTSTALPTKTEYKAAIVNLNNRNIRACGQAIKRYATDGVLTEFASPFQACVLAGMQAGASVGLPLTHKYANVVALRQDSSWNPADDSEEMIQGGACFMESTALGRRVVRNVTTHLSTSNIAYTEGSVNQAVNVAVYNLRNELETVVGKKGFGGTVADAKSAAVTILNELQANQIIVAWRALTVSLLVDVLEVSVEIAPVLPINFVKTTVHLVTVPLSA